MFQNTVGGTTEADLIHYLVNNTDILEQVEHGIRNESWDAKTGEWTQSPHVKPLMNESGVKSVLAFLGSVGHSKVLAMSDLSEDSICKLGRYLHLRVIRMVFANHKKWELDPIDIPNVVAILVAPIAYSLKSVRANGMRNFIKSAQRTERIINETIEPKQGFRWNIFKNKNK